MTQDLYAVWKYDLFPYYLMGEVKEFRDGGYVKLNCYDGMLVEPIKIFPADIGIKKKEALHDIAAQYDKAKEELRLKYMAEVNKLLGTDHK
jgi:hypothetical protein